MGKYNKRSMDSFNFKRGVQAGVPGDSTLHGNNTDSCKCKKYTYYTRGNRKIIRKKSNRTCAKCRNGDRFLQYIFPSSKENRGTKTSNKLKIPQQVSSNSTFQNGHFKQGHKLNQERRLGNLNRFNRRLPTHSHISGPQEVSSVLHKGQSIPIYSTPVRSQSIGKGVHKDSFSSSGILKNAESKTSSLSRRLVPTKCSKGNSYTKQKGNAQSPISARFSSKQRKIAVTTNPTDCLHRRSFRSTKRFGQANFRQNSKNSRSNKNPNVRFSNSKRLSACSGSHGFMCRIDPFCQTSHETNSATPFTFLETSVSEMGSKNSNFSTSDRPFEMVVTASKHAKGQIFTTHASECNHSNGCFNSGLGRSAQQTICAGNMVSRAKEVTHKLSGVGGCTLNNETFSPTTQGSECSHKVRQYHSNSISDKRRRNSFPSVMLQNMGNLQTSNSKQHRAESSAHSRQNEHNSRSTQSCKNKTDRMGAERCHSGSHIQDLGQTIYRPFCLIPKSQNENVLYLGSPSRSSSNGCTNNFMGRDVCLCLSTHMPNTKGFRTHETVPVSIDINSTSMAETSLVHDSPSNVRSRANKAPIQNRSIETAQNSHLSPESRSIQSESMAPFDRHSRTKGFSEKVRKLITASWRAGTRKDYVCKFKQFNSWCSKRQIDPYSASIVQCAEFLADLFNKGLQYRTIAGYRSMLSSLLPSVDNVPMGQHPHIIRLLKGVFNSRPPQVKLVPEWELPKVLELICKAPFEPLNLAPLKYITWKAVFLTAITTYRRASDIQALRLGAGSMLKQRRGLTFIRRGLSKADRPNHICSKIFIPSFEGDKRLDPTRILKFYLEKTKDFRKEENTGLFLSIKEPHKTVTVQTISKWLVQIIKLAYMDSNLKVRGHSTRALGPSWALYNGASIKSILEAADWSRESTFVKFYLRDINITALK